jgi:hypothetical protein
MEHPSQVPLNVTAYIRRSFPPGQQRSPGIIRGPHLHHLGILILTVPVNRPGSAGYRNEDTAQKNAKSFIWLFENFSRREISKGLCLCRSGMLRKSSHLWSGKCGSNTGPAEIPTKYPEVRFHHLFPYLTDRKYRSVRFT